MSWRQVPLSEICQIIMGQAPVGSSYNENGNGYALIAGAGDFGDLIPEPKKHTTEASKISQIDDLIICIRATIGDLNWSDKKYCLGRGVAGLRPNSDCLDRRFLWHFIKSNKHQLSAKGTGSTFKQVSRFHIDEWEIPLPPLPEQKRIAALLDKADAIRRKRQQAIQLADEFLRSVFLELFGDPVTNPKGWGEVKLGDICEVGSSKRVFVDEFTESGIPFYRGTEVGRLGENEDIQPHLYISNDHYENLKKHSGVPKIGDLLLPSICHDGRIWKVNSKTPFYFKDGRVLWIKVNQSSINSDYLRSYLKNLFLANYSSIASGTTFAELKIVILKELSVLSPPLDLQIKYAEIIEKAIKKYGVNKAFSEKSNKLFDSLSQKAFAGEL